MVGGCKMYYFCLDRLSCCRVSCDKAGTAEQGIDKTGHDGPYSTDQECVFAEPDKNPQMIVPCILAL